MHSSDGGAHGPVARSARSGFPTSDSGVVIVTHSDCSTSTIYTTMSQHELSEMEEVELESTANSLSIYRGGTVDQDVGTTDIKLAIFASIVCQDDYWHLSPEVRCFEHTYVHALATCVPRNCASWT